MSPLSSPESTQSLSNPKPVNGCPASTQCSNPSACPSAELHSPRPLLNPATLSPVAQFLAPAGCEPARRLAPPVSCAPGLRTTPGPCSLRVGRPHSCPAPPPHTPALPRPPSPRTPARDLPRAGDLSTHWVGLLCSKRPSSPTKVPFWDPHFPNTCQDRSSTPGPHRGRRGQRTGLHPTHPGRPQLPPGGGSWFQTRGAPLSSPAALRGGGVRDRHPYVGLDHGEVNGPLPAHPPKRTHPGPAESRSASALCPASRRQLRRPCPAGSLARPLPCDPAEAAGPQACSQV